MSDNRYDVLYTIKLEGDREIHLLDHETLRKITVLYNERYEITDTELLKTIQKAESDIVIGNFDIDVMPLNIH